MQAAMQELKAKHGHKANENHVDSSQGFADVWKQKKQNAQANLSRTVQDVNARDRAQWNAAASRSTGDDYAAMVAAAAQDEQAQEQMAFRRAPFERRLPRDAGRDVGMGAGAGYSIPVAANRPDYVPPPQYGPTGSYEYRAPAQEETTQQYEDAGYAHPMDEVNNLV